jgi:hypothetical protein
MRKIIEDLIAQRNLGAIPPTSRRPSLLAAAPVAKLQL